MSLAAHLDHADRVPAAPPITLAAPPLPPGAECSFSTGTLPLLHAHARRQHSEPLVCSQCQLRFRHAAALYRHMASSHPDVPGRPNKVGRRSGVTRKEWPRAAVSG